MCGIAGIISLDRSLGADLIKKMNQSLRHRGPDDEGYIGIDIASKTLYNLYSDDSQIRQGIDLSSFNNHVNMFMAHRRLSIIDLSTAGHQPMSYDNERLWLVYNGEIYNYKELKEELKAKGHEFKTNTDSEVVLASYKEWGNDCTNHFNGDWAFAIYDKSKNVVFLSRDRYAIKPLYYFYHHSLKVFAFASEVKALSCLPHVSIRMNKEKCFEFLAFGLRDHCKQTMYEDVYQVEPGANLVLDLNTLAFTYHKYYHLKYDASLGHYEHKKALAYAEDIRNLMVDSVRLRLRADVAIGTCLSGGLDSSAIVVIINKLLKEGGIPADCIGDKQKTFTSSFPNEPIDETRYAKRIIELTNSEAHYVYPTVDELDAEIRRLVWHQETPYEGASIYSQWKVLEKASKHVKVVLDGQGADETFGGYTVFKNAYFAQLIKTASPAKFICELAGVFHVHSLSEVLVTLKALPTYLAPDSIKILLWYLRQKSFISNSLEKLDAAEGAFPFRYIRSFRPDINHVLFCYQMMYCLPRLLHSEDRNSMAFSLESRTPFTDYRLVDYLFSIPACYKYHNGWSKWLLRLAMKDMLPSEIVWRKDKLGFAVSNKMKENWPRTKVFDIWTEVCLSGQ